MFVLKKQISVLNVPSSRVAILYRSGVDIQLALPDLPSQMGSAFLVMLKGGGKIQTLVGLYMAKSCCNVFYVSNSGEVPAELATQELENGLVFAESMGFVLNDVEIGRMTAEQLEAYWRDLPICQRHSSQVAAPKAVESAVVETPQTEPQISKRAALDDPAVEKIGLEEKRQVLKEQLGKFLASL